MTNAGNAAASVADAYRALVGEGYDFGAVCRRFARFLERRWQMPLPQGPVFTLLPLTMPRAFVEGTLTPAAEALHAASEDYLRAYLRAQPEAATRELAGEAELGLAGTFAQAAAAPQFPVARPDMVVTPDGSMKVLELNSGTGVLGMFWYEQLAGLYLTEGRYEKATLAAGASFPSPLRGLAAQLDAAGAGTVALVDFGNAENATAGTAEYLNRYRRAGKTLYAYAPELELTADGRLRLDSCPVDSVYLNVMPTSFSAPILADVWASVARGGVRALSSAASVPVGSKAGLALIYQAAERGALPSPLLALARALLPAGGILREGRHLWRGEEYDTVPFCRARREGLVVKKAMGQQATDVHVGRTLGESAWDEVLQAALANPGTRYVFQEFVEHPPTENFYYDAAAGAVKPLACRFHIAPFLFGRTAGIGARLGLGLDAHGPMSAPDLGNCSFNLVGTR